MGSRLPYMEHQGEPLLLEQRHFLECVLAHTQPTVSGRDGLAALDTAIASATRRPACSEPVQAHAKLASAIQPETSDERPFAS
jgi:hypothetical protein